MTLALTLLFTGIVIVFTVLILLIAIIQFYGFVITSLQKRKNNRSKNGQELDSNLYIQNEDHIDDEVIAVIAAAVDTYYSHNIDHYQIRSIKRVFKSRTTWGSAGLLQNTKPF